MKNLVLCASALTLLTAWPMTVQAGSYTAMDTSSKSAQDNDEDDLDAALAADDQADEVDEEKELTFEEKLAEFNGGDTVLVETRDILKGRIADKEDKAIGEVKDVYIAEGGAVEGITASLGRLSLSGEVFLSAQDMSLTGSEKGFGIGLSGTEVKGIFSEIPKGAPDSQDGKILSSKAFAGKDVKTMKGKDFGEILDILFSEEGTRVDAALMKISYNNQVKNAVIAVPMEAINFSSKSGRPSFTINSDMAVKVLRFAIAQAEKK